MVNPGGTSSTYTYPPPPAPSHGNLYEGSNMSYTYPHLHQSMPEPIVSSSSYHNVVANSFYPYAPPSAPNPLVPAPQPPMPPPPLPQQQPHPQGQVYAQESATNPPKPK